MDLTIIGTGNMARGIATRALTGKVQRFRLREWAAEIAREEPEAVAVDSDPGLSVGSS